MTTDFRALCAELIASWDADGCDWKPQHQARWEATVNRARAALAKADEPAVPEGREPASVTGQPSDGEVAELVAWLREQLHVCLQAPWTPGIKHFGRAAELLERLSPPQPVPVSVSDALIKAECALSDIAEGEPMTDEGDPLQWAERRCADTLAIIRPTMRQHKIRTSEWPPLPPPTDKEPTRLRNCPTHGQQPPWAWGCPECVRQLREELAALQQRHPAHALPLPEVGQ